MISSPGASLSDWSGRVYIHCLLVAKIIGKTRPYPYENIG